VEVFIDFSTVFGTFVLARGLHQYVGITPFRLPPMESLTPAVPALAVPPAESAALGGPSQVELPTVPQVETVTYTVEKGDTLWDIAKMYGVTHQELAAANDMKPEGKLLVGKVLTIPAGGRLVPPEERKADKPSSPAREPLPGDHKYAVAKGDSLWVIARRFGVKIDDLRKANALTRDTLQPGQVLIIPGGGKAAAVAAPAATAAPAAPPTAGADALAEGEPVLEAAPAGELPPAAGGVTAPTTLPDMLDHTVMPGDTLQGIADMYKITVQAVKGANPTVAADADLVPGMKILIPFVDRQ